MNENNKDTVVQGSYFFNHKKERGAQHKASNPNPTTFKFTAIKYR